MFVVKSIGVAGDATAFIGRDCVLVNDPIEGRAVAEAILETLLFAILEKDGAARILKNGVGGGVAKRDLFAYLDLQVIACILCIEPQYLFPDNIAARSVTHGEDERKRLHSSRGRIV